MYLEPAIAMFLMVFCSPWKGMQTLSIALGIDDSF
jgi:hypothetical protein